MEKRFYEPLTNRPLFAAVTSGKISPALLQNRCFSQSSIQSSGERKLLSNFAWFCIQEAKKARAR